MFCLVLSCHIMLEIPLNPFCILETPNLGFLLMMLAPLGIPVLSFLIMSLSESVWSDIETILQIMSHIISPDWPSSREKMASSFPENNYLSLSNCYFYLFIYLFLQEPVSQPFFLMLPDTLEMSLALKKRICTKSLLLPMPRHITKSSISSRKEKKYQKVLCGKWCQTFIMMHMKYQWN